MLHWTDTQWRAAVQFGPPPVEFDRLYSTLVVEQRWREAFPGGRSVYVLRQGSCAKAGFTGRILTRMGELWRSYRPYGDSLPMYLGGAEFYSDEHLARARERELHVAASAFRIDGSEWFRGDGAEYLFGVGRDAFTSRGKFSLRATGELEVAAKRSARLRRLSIA